MPDLQKLNQEKERIISTIRLRGPCLPIHVAKSTGLSPLFASAFLSELFSEEKIKISNMRVGSSPLYFISGQEERLENYIEHLNQKEREAFQRIKHFKILEDEKLEPAIRVAIRAIKDFAIPTRAIIDGQAKLFWRYHLLSESETKSIIQSILFPEKERQEKAPIKETIEKQKETLEKEKQEIKQAPLQTSPPAPVAIQAEIKTPSSTAQSLKTLGPTKIIVQPIQTKTQEKIQEKISSEPEKEKKEEILEKQKPKKPKKKQEKLYFPEKLKEYLLAKDIEILSSLLEKKNEAVLKIRIDAPFGKQEYLLISKTKKKITEDDLTIALHKAHEEKMPALIMSPGEIDKKALDYLKTWRNLIKFEKIKF